MTLFKECFYNILLLYRYEAFWPMHKRYNSRASVKMLHICKTVKYYRNIPYILIKDDKNVIIYLNLEYKNDADVFLSRDHFVNCQSVW